jgi:hypothetical protein
VIDDTGALAPASGIWRRLWSFIQACEMSTAEYHDLRVEALERRVAELQKELQPRASAPSNEREGSDARDPKKPTI